MCRGIRPAGARTAAHRAGGVGRARAARPVPPTGPPYATLEDLKETQGLCSGQTLRQLPPRKYFLDGTAGFVARGALAAKPAGVFTSTQPCGGQGDTLPAVLPLLHHGMCMVSCYTERALNETQRGGSRNGAA